MSENEALQAVGAEVTESLFSLFRMVELYDANNAAVARVVDSTLGVIHSYVEKGGADIRLQYLENEAFVNGALLRASPKTFERCEKVRLALNRHGVGEVHISHDVPRESIVALADCWANVVRTADGTLPPDGFPGITFSKVVGRSIASFRFEPDRLALWLYASFLDQIDALLASPAGEQSVLPLRRLLQFIVDGMRDHGGIYQSLTLIRDPSMAMTPGQQRAAVAIESVGFATWLGLSPRDRLVLGLAGALGGLSQEDDPERAASPLFALAGLGDTAVPVALAVRDSKAVVRGLEGGPAGQILAIIEWWTRNTAGAGASPATAIDQLANANSAQTAQLFVAYKGRYPLGSVVSLSSGRHAIVVAQGADPAHPIVLPVEGKSVGPPLDLSSGSATITGAPSASQVGIPLHELRSPD